MRKVRSYLPGRGRGREFATQEKLPLVPIYRITYHKKVEYSLSHLYLFQLTGELRLRQKSQRLFIGASIKQITRLIKFRLS